MQAQRIERDGPEKIDPYSVPVYVYAVCKCPVINDLGIKIKPVGRATDAKEYIFKCRTCGFEGMIIC